MRLSRVGIFIIIASFILIGTNCASYNRLVMRRNLVDGAKAYQDRKFADAEKFFRKASEIDPEGKTEEGATAKLFLARTLHSVYVGNRSAEGAKDKALEAIKLYQEVVQKNVNDQSSFNAVAGLFEVLGGQYADEREKWTEEWIKWTSARAENAEVKNKYRADAYASLASKQFTCANEISDTDAVKKTVKKDGKDVYQFVKPEKPEDFEKFKQCVQKGMELIDKAIQFEDDEARNSKNVQIKPLSPSDLEKFDELVKIYGKVWSYKAGLLNQSARWAEMENRTADKDSFKAKADEARDKFKFYNEIERAVAAEKEERQRAADPATAGNANKANSENSSNANQ